jgi:hypothetical protein
MEAEVFAAFKSIGIEHDKASAAAQALSKRESDVVPVKSEIAVLRWMVGFGLALDVAILLKLFVH